MPDPAYCAQEPQTAPAVLMVRPARFGPNAQTAASNAFQRAVGASAAARSQALALTEFDALAKALDLAGVRVYVAPDTDLPAKPDAIFPNNWVSFHADGSIVLYPMLAPNRRCERREDILQRVVRDGCFRVSRTVDLTHREAEGKFLEGTGSLVLDRPHRLAYASLSPRTDLDVLGEFAEALDYELVTFEACDAAARPIYHTNVLLAIGARFAVLCGAAITDQRCRAAVFGRLAATGHEVIDITPAQMHRFAANLLEVGPAGSSVVALSAAAWGSFGAAQRRQLEACAGVVAVDIPTIERVGGGGVRCMLAEIHLPMRAEMLLRV